MLRITEDFGYSQLNGETVIALEWASSSLLLSLVVTALP